MAPLPRNTIDHFSHPGHPLTPVESEREFVCDGCKTLGTGKRHRCNGCDFDLHDYCGTCPRVLSSFMHHHSFNLVIRKPQINRKVDRFCDVCRDPVEGLFYRCKECEFDVHPLCTQLPEKLHHALHKIHPLILQSSPVPSFCGVCRNSCNGWRYRCGVCNFDIHLECVLAPVVPCSQHEQAQTGQRGIPMFGQRVPFQAPPQFAPYYGYGYPYYGPGYNPYHAPGYPDIKPGYNAYHGGPYMHPQQNFVPQNNQVSGSSNNSSGSSRLGKSMFSLVGQLGFGVVSNMIFGVDITALFAA